MLQTNQAFSKSDKLDKKLLYNFYSLYQPNIQPIGLQSARFQSALLINSHILLPIGCSLSIWDIQQKYQNIKSSNKQIYCFQTNSNAISSVITNGIHIFVISFNGEIAILDYATYQLIKRLNQHLGHQNRYVSMNMTHFAVTAELTQQKSKDDGCIHVYDFHGDPVWNLHGRFRFGQLFASCLVVIHEIKIQTGQKSNASQFKQNKNSRKYLCSIQVYKFGQDMPYSTVDLDWGPTNIIFAAKSFEPYNFAAFITSDRRIIIYNADIDKVIYKGKFEGSGAIMSASFSGPDLILNSIKGILTRIKCNSDFLDLPQIIRHHALLPVLSFETIQIALDQQPQFIHEFDTKKYLIINENACYVFENGVQIFKRLFGGITFCGVAMNQDNKYIFAGDFLGNVLGFVKDTMNLEHHYQANTGLAIRSLVHFSHISALAYGTIDGSLYYWDYIQEPIMIASLKGSITILRTTQNVSQELLLASTTDGYIYIFEISQDIKFTQIVCHKAHEPQLVFDAERFGQLGSRAEVWSTCFHPHDATIIATCSEDQNVHIFSDSLSSPKISKVLTGHKLAVTSVDWQQMQQGVVFASCSDDQTVRFYDDELNLTKEISTAWIRDWHTLTYLALQKNGNLVVIGAQNGYLFIYSLPDDKFIYAEKIHLGGIEGLVWKDNVVCTCSSDNTLNIITIEMDHGVSKDQGQINYKNFDKDTGYQ